MGHSEAKEWLRYAKDDLESAEFLLGMTPRKLEIICYHAQQCAEKALKSLLALSDREIPRTHDLRQLAVIAKDLGMNTDHLVAEFAGLQPYAVAVRYPFELDLETGDEVLAIQNARKVYEASLQFSLDFLGLQNPSGDFGL